MRESLLISTAALALTAGAAFASDLPTHKAPPPPPPPAPYNWTGFYGGIEGGYGWGDEHDNFTEVTGFPPPPESTDSFSVSGPIGGVQAGYNQQFNTLVLGVVADIEASDIKGSKSVTFQSEGIGVSSLSMRNSWQSSLRANLGFAFDRLLIYGTGGVAFADDRERYYVDPIAETWAGSQTKTLVGWTLGAGVDYAFDAHWFGGVEVRYADFGKEKYTIPASLSLSGVDTSYKAGFDETLAQVILGYRF